MNPLLWAVLLFVLVCCPPVAKAAGSVVVTSSSTSSTQAVFHYSVEVPSQVCRIKVSESSSYSPLVLDVNPSLYAGSDTDTPGQSVRMWVIGKRTVAAALNGKKYSRALQANTKHYYSMDCGGAITSGTFDTMNIPLGKTFGEPLLVDPATGGYLFPTGELDRNQKMVDPLTGALVKRLSLAGDGVDGSSPMEPPSGMADFCAQQLSNGGYHCLLPANGGGVLYWINPATGEVRYLGYPRQSSYEEGGQFYGAKSLGGASTLWDKDNPNVYYNFNLKGEVVKGTYLGGDAAVPQNTVSAFSWQSLMPGVPMSSLQTAFDPTFNGADYPYGQIEYVQDDDLFIFNRAGEQDSRAWITVFHLGNKMPLGSCGSNCPRVKAMLNMVAHPASRWCGNHSPNPVGDGQGVVQLSAQALKGGGKAIAGHGPYAVTLTAPVTPSDTTFNVSGEPAGPYDGTIQNALVGDRFTVGNEEVRITQKISSTKWVVQRGAGGGSYAAGASLAAICGLYDRTRVLFNEAYWLYDVDPHGTNPAGMLVETKLAGSHGAARGNYRIMADYWISSGKIASSVNNDLSPTNPSAPFAGATGPIMGNTYQKHPSYSQTMASPVEKMWFADMLPLVGGSNIGNSNPPSSNISGQLYKYSAGWEDTLDRTKLATFGVSHTQPLRDISAPNAVLTGSPADSFKYCVVKNAGECVSGSASGDVYFNVPNLDFPYCTGGEAFLSNKRDICIGDVPMLGNSLAQIGVQSSGTGAYNRVLTTAFNTYRTPHSFTSAHALPDGSWIAFASVFDGYTVMLAKAPPYPGSDGIDRTNFISVPVAVPPVSDTTSATVYYGYEENGPRNQFYCTQRKEACAIATTPGQTVQVPAIPQRVVFYQMEYKNSSGQVVLISQISAIVPDSSVLPVVAPPVLMPPPPPPGSAPVSDPVPTVRVYPNPWRSGTHSQGITFELPQDCSLALFTVAGHRIREWQNAGPQLVWDLKAKDGRRAASGIYVYVVRTSAGAVIRGKLAVIQ